MKGIVLAGGSGTRLHPVTRVVSKQLMPVYNKPLVYYPLSTLMIAKIQEILVISTPFDLPRFRELLGDGSWLGLSISYAEQPKPEGLAQAFIIGREFVGDESVCLVLGDNIFYGHGLAHRLEVATREREGATIFGYRVKDPERYAVLEFGEGGRVVGIEEKPGAPKSRYAVPGIYFYDSQVVDIAEGLKPSARGELEITDVNRTYLDKGQLHVEKMGRGIAWLDTGTHESLLQAANFIHAVEERQGLMVGCLEEIAYRQGRISREQLARLAVPLAKNPYGQYLQTLLEEV